MSSTYPSEYPGPIAVKIDWVIYMHFAYFIIPIPSISIHCQKQKSVKYLQCWLKKSIYLLHQATSIDHHLDTWNNLQIKIYTSTWRTYRDAFYHHHFILYGVQLVRNLLKSDCSTSVLQLQAIKFPCWIEGSIGQELRLCFIQWLFFIRMQKVTDFVTCLCINRIKSMWHQIPVRRCKLNFNYQIGSIWTGNLPIIHCGHINDRTASV